MSTTIFLRFADEAEARSVFLSFGYTPDEEGWSAYYTGDFAGARFDVAVVNADGVIRKDGAAVPGYHVNILWHGPDELIPDFGPARVFPVTPECVFSA